MRTRRPSAWASGGGRAADLAVESEDKERSPESAESIGSKNRENATRRCHFRAATARSASAADWASLDERPPPHRESSSRSQMHEPRGATAPGTATLPPPYDRPELPRAHATRGKAEHAIEQLDGQIAPVVEDHRQRTTHGGALLLGQAESPPTERR